MPDNSMYEDLLKAQMEIEGVEKDGKNPFFKSDYTSLNATIFACKQVLNKHNFLVLQPIQSDQNGVYVCTSLIHTSGGQIDSKMTIREAKSNDPQAQGSAITYARRYSLKSFLCMSDNDDDAEQAQNTYRETKSSPQSNPQKKQEVQLDDGLTSICQKHNVKMVQKISARTGNPYWSHKLEDNSLCFGK